MERVVALIAVAAAVLIAVAAGRLVASTRSRRLTKLPADEVWGALDASPDGRPAIVRFTTPYCGDCAVQDRVLGQLAVRILPVDASRRPDVAGFFGVLTAPTTIVLDRSGKVVATNHGLAGADILQRQLELTAATGAVEGMGGGRRSASKDA